MKVAKFKNLKEEREFWDTHDSTGYLDDFEVAETYRLCMEFLIKDFLAPHKQHPVNAFPHRLWRPPTVP